MSRDRATKKDLISNDIFSYRSSTKETNGESPVSTIYFKPIVDHLEKWQIIGMSRRRSKKY